jgi:predicted RNA binding protein YcfA (HicA-like mRNA interferase family)
LTPQRLKRVTGRRLIAVLESLGWYVERVKGSHHIMRHAGSPRVTLSVPLHSRRTLPIGTQADILRDAGINTEDFNERA